MDRRNRMLLAVLAGALTGACRDESPTTTGPSTTGAAVTAAVAYYRREPRHPGRHPIRGARHQQSRRDGRLELRQAQGQRHAFLHRAGDMRDLGALASGGQRGHGSERFWSGRGLELGPLRRDPRGPLAGRCEEEPRHPGRPEQPRPPASTRTGVIVGMVGDQLSGARHAFVWQNGVMTDIGTLGGGRRPSAFGINKAGRVVGSERDGVGGDPCLRLARRQVPGSRR